MINDETTLPPNKQTEIHQIAFTHTLSLSRESVTKFSWRIGEVRIVGNSNIFLVQNYKKIVGLAIARCLSTAQHPTFRARDSILVVTLIYDYN